MLCRLIAADWAVEAGVAPKVIEADLSLEQIQDYNQCGYNCYTWPNHPSDTAYASIPLRPDGTKAPIKGCHVDVIEWCFVDLDLKDYQSANKARAHNYATKEDFIAHVLERECIPTKIVDSGGGIHAYWRVLDLDAKSFLRLSRRLSTYLHTDPATITLNQLLRIPNTLNVKNLENIRPCQVLWEEDISYTAEQLDRWLPPITPEDEAYCTRHYEQVYNLNADKMQIAKELPDRFLAVCRTDKELRSLYFDKHKDRSAADWALGYKLFDLGFTREESLTVLCNTDKARERFGAHQYNYGANIVEKVWDSGKSKVEETKKSLKFPIMNARAVREAREQVGERIFCNLIIDATESGFHLGEVMVLIGGSGNGKSSVSLNMKKWFSQLNVNKNYIHLYFSLEMRSRQVVQKWDRMTEELKKTQPSIDWDDTVYFVDNYDETGKHRGIGLEEIRDYIKGIELETGRKVGSVTIDHLGAVRQNKKTKDSEQEGLIGLCKHLKELAVECEVFLIVQSQTSRGKNQGGDVPLPMDAAYGTSQIEWYADWVLTIWQPLRRLYAEMKQAGKEPLCVTAFQFGKIRDKNVLVDEVQADRPYGLIFNPRTELLREMTSDEIKAYEFWAPRAEKIRKQERSDKSALATITWTAEKRKKLAEDKSQ